jgi:MFS family permease
MVATQRRAGDADGGPVPVLRARDGGPAERFADLFGRAHPAAVFAAALICGYLALAAASILLALFITDVLVNVGGIGSADESAIASIVADRTPFLTDASSVGSAVGGAPVLPILVGIIAIVCAVLRR